MKRIQIVLSVLLVAAASAFAASPAEVSEFALRVKGYMALNGVPQSEFGSGVQVAAVGPSPVLMWDAARLGPKPGDADLPSAGDSRSALDALALEAAASAEAALQAAKSPEQKALENEYFAAVEALAAEAGEAKPTEASAKDLSKVRATVGKVRSAKDAAAGQGKKAKADDLLALRDLQLDLVFIDAELKTYDPDWRGKAKKHDLE